MAVSKIEFNESAFEAIGRSPEVKAELLRRAQAIAGAAGAGFRADVNEGRDRSYGVVWTGTYEARRAEHYDRALTRAIDAGRS